MAEIQLTSWYEEYLIFNKVLYIPNGAGYLNHQQYQSVKKRCFTGNSGFFQSMAVRQCGYFWQFLYRGSTLRIFTVFVSTLLQIWANLDNLDFTRNWNIRNKEIPYSWGPCYMKFLLRWPHRSILRIWHGSLMTQILTPIGPGWQKLSSNQHCLRRRHHSMLCLKNIWQT